MSTYTTYYNLDKYEDTDRPNLRDQYNSSMDKIDAALNNTAGSAASSAQAVSTLQTTVSAHSTQIQTLGSDIQTAQTTATGAAAAASTADTKADNATAAANAASATATAANTAAQNAANAVSALDVALELFKGTPYQIYNNPVDWIDLTYQYAVPSNTTTTTYVFGGDTDNNPNPIMITVVRGTLSNVSQSQPSADYRYLQEFNSALRAFVFPFEFLQPPMIFASSTNTLLSFPIYTSKHSTHVGFSSSTTPSVTDGAAAWSSTNQGTGRITFDFCYFVVGRLARLSDLPE